MEQHRQPAHALQLGAVRAAIWRNVSQDQRVFYNVTFSRQYRAGGELKESSSFGRDDLPVLSKITDQAYAWIWSQSTRPVVPAQQSQTAAKPLADDVEVQS